MTTDDFIHNLEEDWAKIKWIKVQDSTAHQDLPLGTDTPDDHEDNDVGDFSHAGCSDGECQEC